MPDVDPHVSASAALAYALGSLDGAERARLTAHAASCARCAALLERETVAADAVGTALRSLAERARPGRASDWASVADRIVPTAGRGMAAAPRRQRFTARLAAGGLAGILLWSVLTVGLAAAAAGVAYLPPVRAGVRHAIERVQTAMPGPTRTIPPPTPWAPGSGTAPWAEGTAPPTPADRGRTDMEPGAGGRDERARDGEAGSRRGGIAPESGAGTDAPTPTLDTTPTPTPGPSGPDALTPTPDDAAAGTPTGHAVGRRPTRTPIVAGPWPRHLRETQRAVGPPPTRTPGPPRRDALPTSRPDRPGVRTPAIPPARTPDRERATDSPRHWPPRLERPGAPVPTQGPAPTQVLPGAPDPAAETPATSASPPPGRRLRP